MRKMVTITVDGATIRAPEGTSVLDAALEAGICIPNLCHMPDVSPIGACRVCIVEVVENGRRKMTASCTLEAREGMVVEAHSEAVLRARRNIVELILAEAPNSRAIQDLAARVGVTPLALPDAQQRPACSAAGACGSATRSGSRSPSVSWGAGAIAAWRCRSTSAPISASAAGAASRSAR